MKKLFLLITLSVTFSYSQVADENGTIANGSGNTNLTGNIGIGITPTSSSSYKLQVNGKTRFLDNLLFGNPNGARTEINLNNNHKIYAPTNQKTIDIDGNFHGGGFVGVYRADNQQRGVYMHSQPNKNNNALVVREMRTDLGNNEGIRISSELFNGETLPINFISLPSLKSTVIIGDNITYKFGENYGLINKLKTNFGNDVHLETGNLGIGTTSFVDGTDTYRLSVDGKVRAHAIKVYTDWADFVFEKDYKLPTIDEVEAYIIENGHLKDIPSAKEVEEKGIELGKMNKLLLQKVEELTLYIIELKKEVDDLQKKYKD